MSETYQVGDLVEAVKGETTIRGRVVERASGDLGIELAAALIYYERLEFTITVIEKAAPKEVMSK